MSVADINIALHVSDCHQYDVGMTRWEPDPRGRLAQAAMELFSERGFDQTTVAQIAERAGLTERTFFRHFADKREILFAGGAELQELMVAAVAAAPGSASPLGAAAAAIEAAGAMLEEARGRRFARERQRIISASPELRERELHKLAGLAVGISDALRERSVPDPGAALLGELVVAVFRVAFEQWVAASGEPGLVERIRAGLAELQGLVGVKAPTAVGAGTPEA